MKLRYAAITDLGLRRDHNEDCYAIIEEDALVLVADGMGGHAAGEIASGMATKEVAAFFHESGTKHLAWPFECPSELTELEKRLFCGLKLANQRIYEAAYSEIGRLGMGTTMVAAAFAAQAKRVCVAHVGDSRAYRIRDAKIERLTRDHSLLEQFKEINPDMTRDEEDRFPHKNVITRALGLGDFVEIDIRTHDLRDGDLYLLCSDGLSGHITDEEMLAARDDNDLAQLAEHLVERANDEGGSDNITLVIVKCTDE